MLRFATAHRPRREAWRSALHAVLIAGLAAFGVSASPVMAQDGASPRQIPEGFVLPGPAPKGGPLPSAAPSGNIPAESGAAAKGSDAARNPMAFARGPSQGATDWPCMQRRVAEISPAQVWAGPPLPSPADVSLSAEEQRLVDRLVGRRLPLAEAEKMAVDHLDAMPENQREKAATRLVGALLDRFNGERTEVMAGIERYGAKQKALAESLRKQSAAFSTMQSAGKASTNDIENARQALLWDTRVFDERRRSLTYVCEVPVLIEQRAFGLGRAVASAL